MLSHVRVADPIEGFPYINGTIRDRLVPGYHQDQRPHDQRESVKFIIEAIDIFNDQ